jgi:hypothetical protein
MNTTNSINTCKSVPPPRLTHRETLIPLAVIAVCITIGGSSLAHAETRMIANKSDAPAIGLAEAPLEPFPKIETDGAGATLTRDPDGGFRLSAINGPDIVKISGKASRIVIDDINGEPVVDLSGLVTPQVEFTGTINGGPLITVACDSGSVEFRQSINGSPRITINCPGGSVGFMEAVGGSTELTINAARGNVRFHTPVNGGSKVKLTARQVEFSAGIDGGATVDLTLTSGGSLAYGRLNGGGSITFRKAGADDPGLAVHGDPSGSGHLIEAPPAAAKPD